jgi:phosphatidate cytidylyltransferase
VLAILLTVALLLGRVGVAFLLAGAGLLSLHEYLRIIGWNEVGRPTAIVVFSIVPTYYSLLLLGDAESIRSIAPAAILIVLGATRASLGLVQDFVRTTAAMIWGVLLFVYCLSHAYLLLTLPGLPEPWVGTLGWFLYLVLLTETNDIAQALIGRPMGRNKMWPRVSPNKSLEGLLGAMIVTAFLALLLAPWLTTFMQNSLSTGVLLSVLSGLLISMFGFLGDLNKSGIKRDVGIKDSGTLLPGQGGMIDRVDSLTFSAPVFFFFVQTILAVND